MQQLHGFLFFITALYDLQDVCQPPRLHACGFIAAIVFIFTPRVAQFQRTGMSECDQQRLKSRCGALTARPSADRRQAHTHFDTTGHIAHLQGTTVQVDHLLHEIKAKAGTLAPCFRARQGIETLSEP
jgi:hypothetical protein